MRFKVEFEWQGSVIETHHADDIKGVLELVEKGLNEVYDVHVSR